MAQSSIPPVLSPTKAPKLDPGLAEARFAMAEIINCIEKGCTLDDLRGALRELGNGCFAIIAGRAEDRFCSSCGARVNAWELLELVGYQLDGTDALELRNCKHCGTTMSAEVAAPELGNARFAAFEAYVRAGEALGRVVELKSVGGRLCLEVRHRHGTERTLRGVETLAFAVQTLLGGP